MADVRGAAVDCSYRRSDSGSAGTLSLFLSYSCFVLSFLAQWLVGCARVDYSFSHIFTTSSSSFFSKAFKWSSTLAFSSYACRYRRANWNATLAITSCEVAVPLNRLIHWFHKALTNPSALRHSPSSAGSMLMGIRFKSAKLTVMLIILVSFVAISVAACNSSIR